MSDNAAEVIVAIVFFLFLGWMAWLDHKEDSND